MDRTRVSVARADVPESRATIAEFMASNLALIPLCMIWNPASGPSPACSRTTIRTQSHGCPKENMKSTIRSWMAQ